MASAEESRRRPSVTSSSVGLEALFPGGTSEHSCGERNPELERVRERLQDWLLPYEAALLWFQRLLVWERPLYSISVAVTLNTLFWLLSYTSLRPLFLLSVSLLGLMLLERWKPRLLIVTIPRVEISPIQSESVSTKQRLLSLPELSHHLAESYLTSCLFLHETLQYKRQNHGKFCAVMCSGCFVLAVVGHYVPGIMISYIIGLSVILWPLVVYHELIQRMYTGLEPILMKLDYSMKGDTEPRKHDKRKLKKEMEEGDEPRAETESESDEELSCFAPTVDVKTTALAMAITDSELSDEEASILESGGFSVSRATTPQLTDVSEDLDQQSLHSDPEESYLRDLPEFPSIEEFPSFDHNRLRFPLQGTGQSERTQASAPAEAQQLSPASLLIQHLASPLHFVNTHFNGHGRLPGTEVGVVPAIGEGASGQRVEEREALVTQGAQRSLEALSEEIVSTAISTVVQNTLSALLRSSEANEEPVLAEFLPHESPPGIMETSAQPTENVSPVMAQMLAPDEDLETITTESITGDYVHDDTLVATEEEDFELLDQSELEQADEGLELSPEKLLVGETLEAAQHQHQS
ncbi:reticulophagy regulator 2 [Syngnathoides biaculeatus]|uniref:reticulophagy regulator 2 n=1 Tax=Syngnathoides biaculeatus TaxID=300417 RepID=UPI002ADE006F|nr:reticulophagy regulator 2 [Syngnathoides biaculeatus]